jgi:anti-sigma factor RsiW
MTEDPHRHWQDYLGAYAMNRLTPQEHAEVKTHIQTCQPCTEALKEIAPIAKMLPLANPRNVVHKPHIAPQAADKLFAKIAGEKRAQARKTRYQMSSMLAAAAAVIVALLVVPMVTSGPPSGTTVQFASAPADVKAKARIVNESWGTEVHIDVAGLKGRQTVWFEQPDGTRASAGSFEGGNGDKVDLVLSTAFKSKDAVALCVSPPNEPAVLRAPLNA